MNPETLCYDCIGGLVYLWDEILELDYHYCCELYPATFKVYLDTVMTLT